MSLAILFHLLCAQHISDIHISIITSLQLFCWITTLVVFFLVRLGWSFCVDILEWYPCSRLKPATHVVIQKNSRKLLMMDILISETCWAHKKWNKISIDINFALYSSIITMMHGPINISFTTKAVVTSTPSWVLLRTILCLTNTHTSDGT